MKLMRILVCVMLCGLTVSTALASKPVPTSPLATAPTYCDAQGVWQAVDNRVVDARDGRLQCVSDLYEGGFSGTPEDVAQAFLRAHEDWVGLSPDANLRVVRSVESPFGHHVTFERVIAGVPVYPGDLVVSMDKENVVRFYFSSLYTFAEKPATGAALSAEQATNTALDYLKPTVSPRDPAQTELVIWAGDNRDFAPAWRVRQFLENPMGDWEVLVDANRGQVRRAVDRACYIDGQGYTYRPDPLTSAGANYNDAGYTDGADANTAQLQAQRSLQTLRDITFSGGVYRLQGPYCTLIDFENPAGAPVTSPTANGFTYLRDAQGFEDVNVYYHIDASQRWIQSLGFTNIQNLSIGCDPHGLNGDDNSHYIPSSNRLAWGEGGVDDAEDADVIWHEYGHAIQHGTVPGWGGGDEERMGEGFGDYWAASYSRSLYTFRSNWVFNWDGHNPFWAGRAVDLNLHYPEDNTGVHYGGQIWSQACYDAMLLISRSSMDQIVLGHHFLIGTGATMLTAAQALLTYDGTANGGANRWAISDAGVPRGLLTRPSNDVCPGTSITSLPYSTTGSTATADNNYSNCIGSTSPDVVYSMTLSSCQTVTVSLCGSGYDTAVEVRSGGSCPGSTQVACDDDGCGYPYSRTTFVAQGGVTYYIIVHGYATYSGSYSLSVTGTPFAPPNDVCPGTVIASLPYTDTGNTVCANNNYTNCVGSTSREVLYAYTPSVCQTVNVSLCNSGYDTGVGVYTGGSCPGSTLLACDDDGCGYPYSALSFNAVAGVTYWIRVHGYAVYAGPYNLSVTGTPFSSPNDVCPGATIASLPYTDTGDTRCATSNYSGCVGTSSRDVVYNYTPVNCQTVTASLCGSGYDTGIEVRTGTSCPGTTSVACDDDYCVSFGPSQVTFQAIAGQFYYIIVHGWSTSAGPYVLNVTGTAFTPPNDVCPGTAIAALPYTDTGDTRCATNNYDAGCVYGDPADVVYNLTLASCQTVTVSLCGSGYDTGLEVRTGGACPGATVVACNDDWCGLQSQVSFVATAGETYYIIVDGFNLATGPFVINVSGTPYAPPNDVCPGTAIATLPYTDSGSTRCATNNYDAACVYGDAADVVYNLTLAACQTVTVTLCGSSYDTGLSVRTGGACPGTSEIGCNDDSDCGAGYVLQSTVVFTAQAGTAYYIIVDGFNVQTGPFVLNVTGQPCAAPAAPNSLVILLSGTNINLYWPTVPGAASYKVYRKATSDVAPVPTDFLANAPANSYIDAGVINAASRYFYLVTAMSAAGDLLAALPPQSERPDDAAYAESKLEQARSGRSDVVMVYEPVLPSFAARDAESARESAAKSLTGSSAATEVAFVPYRDLNTYSEAIPDKASGEAPAKSSEGVFMLAYTNPEQQRVAEFQKKEMPADETLRVDNVYFPAYTQFTSPNVTK